MWPGHFSMAESPAEIPECRGPFARRQNMIVGTVIRGAYPIDEQMICLCQIDVK